MTTENSKNLSSSEVYIGGMTCTSCEAIVSRSFKKISGVKDVDINHRTGQCTVTYDSAQALHLTQLQKQLPEQYTIYNSAAEIPLQKRDWKELIIALIGVALLYPIFKSLGVFSGTAATGSDSLTYGAIFLVGIVAALSSCTAIIGGLILSFSANFSKAHPNATGLQRFKPHILFNAGRIVSYFVLGGVIGALGSVFTLSPRLSGALTVLIAGVMVLLAIDILQLFKANRFIPRMPKFVTRKLEKLAESNNPIMPFVGGALTFFLPCGFTQSMQLYALSTGSFWQGGLTMLVFAVGTLPALLSVGVMASFSKGNVARYFMKFSGVAVLLLGLFTFKNGLTLLGINVTLPAAASSSNTTVATAQAGKQVIKMAVDGIDYVPSSITLQKGVPVEWHIDGSKSTGCTSVITVPSLGITKALSRDKETIITFTPQTAGNIAFTCSMGMASGRFTVVDQLPTQPKEPTTSCDPAVQNCIKS